MTFPLLVVIEDRNRPRVERYQAFIDEPEGCALVGSGPTDQEAVIDAQEHLEAIFTQLRQRTYALQVVERLDANACPR